VELLHTFTLVHDDIMDADKMRRGIKTAHEAFGVPAAINMGDYLHATAYFVASGIASPDLGGSVQKSLATAARDISMGQNLDMSFEKLSDVTVNEYVRMIDLKTAALYRCAASMGGMIGGLNDRGRVSADMNQLKALEIYGKNLGLAFQIRDDYLGAFGDESKTGKSVGNDIRRGKRTFILIKAMELASVAQKEKIWRVAGRLDVSESALSDALQVLRDLRVDSKSQALSEEYERKAVSALDIFDDSEAKRLLTLLSEYAITRES